MEPRASTLISACSITAAAIKYVCPQDQGFTHAHVIQDIMQMVHLAFILTTVQRIMQAVIRIVCQQDQGRMRARVIMDMISMERCAFR